MKLIPHEDSTSVSGSAHDGALTMRIQFASGHTYEANDVPAEKHEAFLAAESKGGHWHKHLKSAHVWTRV